MSSTSGTTLFGNNPGVPSLGMQVTYVLTLAELMKYQVQQIYPATITFIHTALSVDLQCVVNVPAAVAKSALITGFNISGNVVTFTAANNFSNGDIVTISGLSTGTYLNGQTLTVLVGSYVNASGTTVIIPAGQFVAAFTHANVGQTSDSGTAQQVQATLQEKAVSFGNSQTGNWYPGQTFTGVLPTGSPW